MLWADAENVFSRLAQGKPQNQSGPDCDSMAQPEWVRL